MFNIRVLSLILMSSLLLSCGKKFGDSSNQAGKKPAGDRDTRQDYGRFLDNQKLICEDDLFCPDNIAKVIVINQDNIRFCTGTLIAPNKMVTSASCLERTLRIPHFNCSNNIYAVFPKSFFLNEEVVACKRIDYVDNNVISEPALWKNDLVVFSLERSVTRKVSPLTQEGMGDKESFTSWKIDYVSDYVGVLKRDTCETVHNTYLNPFTESKHSPMTVATGCEFSEGNIGAPIFRNSDLVGVYSGEMSSRIYNYLENRGILSEKLGRYYHISNTACTQYDQLRNGKGIPVGCRVEPNINRLDTLRAGILKGKAVHQDAMNEIELKIETPEKYFNWDVKFFADRKSTTFEAHLTRPKCIYKSDEWIGAYRRWGNRIRTYARIEIETPHYIFRTKLNKYLRPISILDQSAVKKYQIEFNPFNAHVNKSTYVTITSELLGEVTEETYEAVTDKCN